jgi:GTP-binding protein
MKPGARLPVVAIVGRPNVGKSTLFNRMTRSRDALVADMPGLTRDRHYGTGRIGERPFLVIDTGGFEPVAAEGIVHEMAKQTRQAIAEADALIFLVDGRQGLTAADQAIAADLRKSGRPLTVAVNKAEGMRHGTVTAEFHELGLGDPVAISSAHGDGVRELVDLMLDGLAPPMDSAPEEVDIEDGPRRIRIAIVGRPNVGKSTLVNALLGEERVIVFDMPGTTRDSIHIDFDREGKQYTLIDTAGLRRRGQVFEAVEKFSVVKTLQSVADANVVVLVLDAQQEISDQDAHIAGFVVESGRAVVIAINKWDGLDDYSRERIKRDAARKLQFLAFAKSHHISALKGQGIGALMRSVDGAAAAAFAKLPTPKLTRALVDAVDRQTPPRRGVSRPKLRYAHQGGQNPPVIVIHGNGLDQIPETYRRYLEASFRETFSLQGTPLRVEFRTTRNPYASKAAG